MKTLTHTIRTIALFGAMVVALVPTTMAQLTYSFNSSNGVLTIAGSGTTVEADKVNLAIGRESSYVENTTLKGIVFNGTNIEEIGYNAFRNCKGLNGALNFPPALKSISDYAFQACSASGALNFPTSVTAIGFAAFELCSGFTSVSFPNSLVSIGDYSFKLCRNIEGTIQFSEKLTNIGIFSLEYLEKVTEFNVHSNNQNYCSINGIIYDKEIKKCVACPAGKTGILSLPSTIIQINLGAFTNSDLSGTLVLPNSISTLQWKAFMGSKFSGQLNLPSSITNLEASAFELCTLLTGSITIPSTVKVIAPRTFFECSGLNGSLILHDDVSAIQPEAFYGCNFSYIKSKNFDPPLVGNNAFLGINTSICILYVPFGALNSYKNAEQWKNFVNIIETDFLTEIEEFSPTSKIVLYPNPASHFIQIKGIETVSEYKIVDVQGKLHRIGIVEPNTRIDVSKLATGSYFVIVKGNSQRFVKK